MMISREHSWREPRRQLHPCKFLERTGKGSMAFVSLHSYFPDLAERETRSITVLGSDGNDLPPGGYAFVEMFCDDAGCDCRRVLFLVVGEFHEKPLATIGWGWEDREFYETWSTSKDPSVIDGMMGPELNPGGRQSDLAPGLLQLVRETLLVDEAYVERVKQHYALMRAQVGVGRRLRTERLFGKGSATRPSSRPKQRKGKRNGKR